VRGVPSWALKGGAAALTVLAMVASASYVGGHVKSHSAPLRPSLQPDTLQPPAGRPGELNLGSGVRTTSSDPVTEVNIS